MAIYGISYYGQHFYGPHNFPTSTDFNIFDFVHPTESVMTNLFAFPELQAERFGAPWSWFNGDDDYCMYSDDEAETGFRADIGIPTGAFSFEFSILPTALPVDFSSLSTARVFVAIYNAGGKAVGLLLSEEGGIALATDATTIIQEFPDSSDIFDEGLFYYIFRLTVDETTGQAILYVTRKDVYAVTGVHEIRYTFTAPDCPTGQTDHLEVYVVGTAADPTQMCLDSFRLGDHLLPGNQRPVAVVTRPDLAIRVGAFGYFDGRESYDPDTPPQPLTYWWTVADAPESSTMWIEGTADSPADPSGYTNRITGSSQEFADVRVGDIVSGELINATIVYISDDNDEIVCARDVFPAGETNSQYRILKQSSWGGSYVEGVMLVCEERGTAPPGSPVVGGYYLVEAPASGDWAGHDGEIAFTSDGFSWSFTSPAAEFIIYVKEDYECYRHAGSGLWRADDPRDWELDQWEGRSVTVASVATDTAGIHDVELVVFDGVRTSLPALAILNAQQLDSELGVIPDMSFFWPHLPGEFWDLVENREVFETFWSGICQLGAGLLIELYQHQISLDLFRMQRTFQKGWINYNLRYEETSYSNLPATIRNTINTSGYSATPGTSTNAYDLGVTVSGITDTHYLILEGVAYRILRTNEGATTIVVTQQAIPTTDRPSHWMVRPTLTSTLTNFTSLRVTAGDIAVFEVREADGGVFEVEAFVYGVRDKVLCFDDVPISTYLSTDGVEVLFKSVIRRGSMNIDSSIVSIPRLQEVVNYGAVVGAADPIYEGRHYRIEENSDETKTLLFIDPFLSVVDRGVAGATTVANKLEDADAEFETTFGEGADLSNHLLEIDGVRYRLLEVKDDNTIVLEDQALEVGSSGLRWKIYSLDDVPERMWAEVTHLDNEPVIEENFGRLVNFTLDQHSSRTDDLDYLSAVQGFWYYVYNARTLYGTRVASQIMLGLPFAEKTGEIIDIQAYDVTRTRVLVRDTDDKTVVRSYIFPTVVGLETNPDTGVDYVLGDTIQQFAPLSEGVEVHDYIDDPEWIIPYVASGDLYEVQKLSHFIVKVRSSVFDLTNLELLSEFLRKHRVEHRDPFFAVVVDTLAEGISVADSQTVGPLVPDGYTYPSTWPSFAYPVGWTNSPYEVPKATITDHYPTTPPVPPLWTDWGGLKLEDVPGSNPSGWTGAFPDGAPGTHAAAISEGSFRADAIDPRGRVINVADPVPTNLLSDGDMEDAAEPGAGDWDIVSVTGLTTTKVHAGPVHGGSKSIKVFTFYGGGGVEQQLPSVLDENFQIAARLWVYLEDGQAHIQLIDQDGTTVLDEHRLAGPNYIDQWVEITLHAWVMGDDSVAPTLRAITGPGGGTFYIDDAAVYHTLMPWTQFGSDRFWGERTGGATPGSLPDEDLQTLIAINHAGGIPVADAGWCADASSVNDRQRTAGPATAPLPPGSWSAPGVSNESWRGPNYGNSVDTWKDGNGYTGYGTGLKPTEAIRADVSLPAGWYTRIVDLLRR